MEMVSRVANSELAWHFLEIHGAAQNCIELQMNFGGKHPTENRAITDQEAFSVWLTPPDLSAWKLRMDSRTGDIPKQLAELLRAAADELQQIAADVEGIPGKELTYVPTAFLARDHETGEVITTKLQLKDLKPTIHAYQDVRNHLPAIDYDSIENHPDLLKEWGELVHDAESERPNG
jgi:hypothetical protein